MTLLSFHQLLGEHAFPSISSPSKGLKETVSLSYMTASRNYQFLLSCEKDTTDKNVEKLKQEIEDRQKEISLLEEKA